MRKLPLLAVTAAVLAAAAPARAATVVTIMKTKFDPSSLTVSFDSTVTWKNADTQNHQVVADNGLFASAILKPGATYSYTFHTAGRFRYHDALKPTLRGTVTVNGPPPSLTLGASQPIVVWGQSVALTGTISTGKASQNVTIFEQPYGQGSFAQVATVLTGSGGGFSYQVQPGILTAYMAKWGSAQSAQISVQVKPKLTFTPCGGRFCTRVSVDDHSFAEHFVYLQRLSTFGQWVTVLKLRLGPLSGRIFDIPRRSGTSIYRIYLSVNQAGLGFLDSHSGTQRIHRR